VLKFWRAVGDPRATHLYFNQHNFTIKNRYKIPVPNTAWTCVCNEISYLSIPLLDLLAFVGVYNMFNDQEAAEKFVDALFLTQELEGGCRFQFA
jgi:hypothetical protein